MQAIGLFCEDIREEKSGQLNLIGIMPDNLNIPATPAPTDGKILQAMIPKLALYVRVHLEPEDDPGEVQISLIFPNGDVSNIASFPAELVEESKSRLKKMVYQLLE
jgi:hypothetical protein